MQQVYRGCLDHSLRLTVPCPNNAMSSVDDYGCCRVPFAAIELDHIVDKMQRVINDDGHSGTGGQGLRVNVLLLLSDDPLWIVQQQAIARVKYPW